MLKIKRYKTEHYKRKLIHVYQIKQTNEIPWNVNADKSTLLWFGLVMHNTSLLLVLMEILALRSDHRILPWDFLIYFLGVSIFVISLCKRFLIWHLRLVFVWIPHVVSLDLGLLSEDYLWECYSYLKDHPVWDLLWILSMCLQPELRKAAWMLAFWKLGANCRLADDERLQHFQEVDV